jgi:2-oxoglutarate ferredoxin oxidoreductase subunit beta
MVTLNDYDSDFENKWCPGCGNFGILKAMKTALVELGLAPHEIVIFSGIGQSSKTPHFLKCNMFHSLHGRALTLATGAKVANHGLTVLVSSGDGDCYGEGGNHFLHAVRRNVDLTLLVHNNKIYGLTKGQASPTSDRGMVTKAQPKGVILEPFNPLAVALALRASFIARGFSGKIDQLSRLIQAGIRHRGFSLIDILQPCPSFNHLQTFKWYTNRVYDLEQEEDYDPTDYAKALDLAQQWGDRIPTGIIFREERPSFTDQIEVLREGSLLERPYDPNRLREFLAQMEPG